MTGSPPFLGLISDTHGQLRAEAVEALRGAEAIVHAGDVGRPEILDALRGLAPVTVVRGNVDHGSFGESLPMTAELEYRGVWLHVRHIREELDLDPAGGGFDVVVYGHSHRPEIERRGGVLWVNPGSAGPRRFRLPVTVARFCVVDGVPEATLIELDV